MKTALSLTVQALAAGAALHYLGLTNAASLLIFVIAVAAVAMWRFLAGKHRLERLGGDDEDGRDESPHPLAVVAGALTKAAVLLGLTIPFFAGARLATPYRLPFEHHWFPTGERSRRNEASPQRKPAALVTTPLRVVRHTFVDPSTHMVDGICDIPTTATFDRFELTVDGQRQPIKDIEQITFEYPLAVSVLRDVTSSVMGTDPFPQLGQAATQGATAALAGDSRRTKVRIANFSEKVVTVQDWTDDYRHLGELRLEAAAAQTAAASAVTNNIVQEIRGVSVIPDALRIVVVISDFANNVPSRHDAYGLAAEAKRTGVILILIYLKTKDFPSSALEQLKLLAKETGGVCIDGADPTLDEQIKMALEKTRHTLPAYRLMFDAAGDIDVSSIQIRAAVVETPLNASVTQVSR